MTDEQINQRIAEVCGWKHDFNEDHENPEWYWIPPNNPDGNGEPPNYCNDLNVMHEAEKVLKSFEHLVNYHALLGYCGGTTLMRLHECITATARQRAEAFLRTLGKWEDEQ
jgi:hypothetical protein